MELEWCFIANRRLGWTWVWLAGLGVGANSQSQHGGCAPQFPILVHPTLKWASTCRSDFLGHQFPRLVTSDVRSNSNTSNLHSTRFELTITSQSKIDSELEAYNLLGDTWKCLPIIYVNKHLIERRGLTTPEWVNKVISGEKLRSDIPSRFLRRLQKILERRQLSGYARLKLSTDVSFHQGPFGNPAG